ncbi:MAG: pilus assembly protein [Rhodospirillales bacterium]|jgi:Flp pilus assembly protein TadG|nr:pilus assembly protein [Rhodospirillales bacterium]
MNKIISKLSKFTGVRGLFRSRRAATAVEFALVMPIFLIMVIGIFEMSRAMWIKASMQFAAEETTRYAIVNTGETTATLETYALAELGNSGMNISGASFTATKTVSGSITYVDVSGTYTFSSMVPLVPFPDTVLSAKSRVPTQP